MRMAKKTVSNYEQEKVRFEFKLEYTPESAGGAYCCSLNPGSPTELGFPGIAHLHMTHLLIAPKMNRQTWMYQKCKVSADVSVAVDHKKCMKYNVTAKFKGRDDAKITHPMLVLGHLYGDDERSYAVHWIAHMGRKWEDDNPNPLAFAYIRGISAIPSVKKILPLDANLDSLLCLEGSLDENYPGQLFVYSNGRTSYLCEFMWVRDIAFDEDRKIIATGNGVKEDITEAVQRRLSGDANPDHLEKVIARTIIIPFSEKGL